MCVRRARAPLTRYTSTAASVAAARSRAFIRVWDPSAPPAVARPATLWYRLMPSSSSQTCLLQVISPPRWIVVLLILTLSVTMALQRSTVSLHVRQVRAPPPVTRAPAAPHDDDDHELLCDCGWTRWPGQSCRETRSKPGFACWHHCCQGVRR